MTTVNHCDQNVLAWIEVYTLTPMDENRPQPQYRLQLTNGVHWVGLIVRDMCV